MVFGGPNSIIAVNILILIFYIYIYIYIYMDGWTLLETKSYGFFSRKMTPSESRGPLEASSSRDPSDEKATLL